jgi:hypothetical protein
MISAITSSAQSCTDIKKEVDDFRDETNFYSPIMEDSKVQPVLFQKTVTKTVIYYFVSLRAKGSIAVVDGKGITVLFTDGSKWTDASSVDVKAASNGFEYSAFIALSKEDVDLFASKKINKYRLYTFDTEIAMADAIKFQAYMKCLLSAGEPQALKATPSIKPIQ